MRFSFLRNRRCSKGLVRLGSKVRCDLRCRYSAKKIARVPIVVKGPTCRREFVLGWFTGCLLIFFL